MYIAHTSVLRRASVSILSKCKVYPHYRDQAGESYAEIEAMREELRAAVGGKQKVTFSVVLVLGPRNNTSIRRWITHSHLSVFPQFGISVLILPQDTVLEN